MNYDFVRSHGLGNVYLVADPKKLGFELTPPRIRTLCNPHLGIGSDGILAVAPSSTCDFGVRIFNPDGSEAEKSGNGIRIFSRFLFDHGYTTRRRFRVETLGGPIEAELFGDNSAQLDVRVEMGQATINPDVRSLEVEGRLFPVSAVSVGNPHAVYISPDARLEDLLRWGPHIETHPAFPNRTNVQFVRVLSRSEIQVFVWERGAGHTQSSGSSACAAVFACFDRGLVDTAVTVQLEGGALQIEVRPPNQIIMSGPVEETCVLRLAENLRRRLLAQ